MARVEIGLNRAYHRQDIVYCQSSVLIDLFSVRQSAQLDDCFSLLFSFQGKKGRGGQKEKVRRLFFSTDKTLLIAANPVFLQ